MTTAIIFAMLSLLFHRGILCERVIGPQPSGAFCKLAHDCLSLPRTLGRREAEFPVLQGIGRLSCPMDFMDSTGALFPMTLCDHSSLYSPP
jgi:hypothetical protein